MLGSPHHVGLGLLTWLLSPAQFDPWEWGLRQASPESSGAQACRCI